MKRAAPYLLFAGVTLAVFWKFLLFGQTMYAMSALESQLGLPPTAPRGWFRSELPHARISDNLVLLAGHLRLYNEGIKANELRLWNPTLFCGLPTYADPMLHPFYPPNLILHRLLPPDAAYEVGSMLHLFFVGVAMYALLLAIGRSRGAACAGGLIWMLGGYHAMWFSTGVLTGLMVFGPLALRAIHLGIEKRDLSQAARAGAFMGLAILGSHPQFALLFFLFLLGWMGFAAVLSPPTRAFTARYAALFALLSLGVGMAEILTRLDTIENGYRAPEYDALSLYAEPWRLATYASGLLLGKTYFPGPGWEAEFAVFTGLGAVGLAVLGAIRNRGNTGVRYLCIAGVAALATAFFYPLAWVFMKIPLLSLSPPSRCLFILAFCIPLLAAYGWDELAAAPGRAWRGFAWVTAVFALIALVGVDAIKFSNGAAVETLLGFAGVSAAAWGTTRWKQPAAALGLAALIFELLPPLLQFNAHTDSSLLLSVPAPVTFMKKETWRGTGILGTRAETNKTEAWGHDLVTGNNLLALYGVNNIGGFEAIIPRAYVTFAHAAGAKLSPAGRTLEFTRFDSPLVDLTALRTVLLPPGLPMPSHFRETKIRLRTTTLFENSRALPRARLASSLRTVKDEAEAEQVLRDPGFDPHAETILEAPPGLTSSSEGDVTWKERTPDRIVLDVTPKAPSVLVLADTNYPGWEATVDGERTPIYAANVAFRAIVVPAGGHTVEFRFRPTSARHGGIASACFLALSIAGAFYRRKA